MASLLEGLTSRFRRKVSPMDTAGHMGTAVFGGYVTESEKNYELRDREKYKTYANVIANTTIVSAGIRFYLNLVQKAGWTFNPADDSPLAAEYAEIVGKIIHQMDTPWSRVVRRAAMYKFYGFSIQEWTAVRRPDGMIVFRDIAPRAQITIERWDVDLTGKVHGVIQKSPQTSEDLYLPRSKVLYIVDDSLNDSPEGLGILRNVVEPAKRLSRYQQLEGFGFETDLRGVPIGRAPYQRINELVQTGQLSREEATAQLNVIETFIKKHIKNPESGVVLDSSVYETIDERRSPSGQPLWDISLMQGSDHGLAEVAAAIERVNHEIARVLGVEQLLLGQSRGTQALSEDKSHNFALIVGSALNEIKESVDRDLIKTIGELNGWDPDLLPTSTVEELQFKDPKDITGALAELARAALDPEDPAINVIRDLMGLPDALIANDMVDTSLVTREGVQPTEVEATDDLVED